MNIKKITYLITLLALFLVPLFSLIVTNSLFFPFITGKVIYFRILVEIAFAGWIVLAFIDPKYRPKITPLSVGVTIFTVVALLADLLGVNPLRSIWSNFERMEGWMTIVHLWAFFITITNVFGLVENGRKLWYRWFNLSISVAFITAIYGVIQLLGYAEIHQGGTRLDASLGNSAYFGIYMLIHVFLAAYMFINTYKSKVDGARFVKWYYAILSVLFTFLVFETQTRGTILGLISGIMLALFLYTVFAQKDQQNRKYRKISFIILIILVALSVVFWMNRKAPIIQNSALFGRLANISWKEAKGQARNYVWPMAIKGALERPIFGWGQENFNYIFNANYEPKMYAQEQWFDRAHSVFLDWFVSGGFVGLFAYLALYVILLVKIWKSSTTSAEKSIMTGLVVGYIIHNIFVFDNIASYVMFFAIMAFVDSYISNKKSSDIKLFGNNNVSKDAIEYVVLPITIVGLILIFYFVQYRVVKANTRLVDAMISCSNQPSSVFFENALKVDSYVANQEIREQALSCATRVINNPNISTQVKESFFELALNTISSQVKATPKDARIYVLGGSFMNNVGQYSNAMALLEKALELSPGKQTIILELITSYINLGINKDKSIELAKMAYESAPDFPQTKYAYVTALLIADKELEARDIFKDDQSIFNSVQIARVYFVKKEYSKAIKIYRDLIKSNPDEVSYYVQLAQIQYTAGLKYDAIEVLNSLVKKKPELKADIDYYIKQLK